MTGQAATRALHPSLLRQDIFHMAVFRTLLPMGALLAATTGVVAASVEWLATEIRHLQRTEVSEAEEHFSEGQKGSSAMPHKRNPVGCAVVLAAATRVPGLVATLLSAMVQEHERGLGGWHAEWQTLPDIVMLCAGALAQLDNILGGLELDPARMRTNLDATHGLMLAEAVTMALGASMGRLAAHQRVEAACQAAVAQGRDLRAVLGEDADIAAHLSGADLDRLLDPAAYIGLAEALIERVLKTQV